MIDYFYKNHQFVDAGIQINKITYSKFTLENNFYLCLKCNNCFWYQDKDSTAYDNECVDSQYFLYSKERKYFDGMCILTCEELIIKNIIE